MTFDFFQFFHSKDQRARSRVDASARARRERSSLKPRRLATETLEERQLLAVDAFALPANFSDSANIIEISADDLSIEALKQAVKDAAATPGDDVIYASGGTLTFASAADEITIDVDSDAYGAIAIVGVDDALTLDAAGFSRAISVKSGTVYLENIAIVNGAADYGAAIANGGDLTLVNATLKKNVASVAGGAIANKGELAVQNSILDGNSSSGDGAALYQGDFDWPVAPEPETPEWQTIPDQVGSKGTTLSIDLTNYVNDGDWTYSFEIAETTSAILASAPILSNGILSFTFIGDSDFSAEDDYSAISVTVSAANGDASASQTFSVSLAEQTSVSLAAILSNMSIDDVYEEYELTVGTGRNKRTGYANADGIPAATTVDVSSSELNFQVWAQDFASSASGDAQKWDAGTYFVAGYTYRVHLENATFVESAGAEEFNAPNVLVWNQLENGDYEFMVGFFSDPKFGCSEAILLDVVTIQAIDASQPVTVSLYQGGTDVTTPTVQRMYTETGVSKFQPDARFVNIDPSQTLFIGTSSDATTTATPGTPFETINNQPIVRTSVSSAELDFSNATTSAMKTTISNTLIVGNAAIGAGVLYAAEDSELFVRNATIADNSATGAAVYFAGSTSNSVVVDNSILVNGALAPTTDEVSANYNLASVDLGGSNVVYQNGTLFVNAGNGDYALATGSEAINIGSDDLALDVYDAALTTDLSGASRFSATVDVGAYEYQGTAPNAPASVSVSNYLTANKKPNLAWRLVTDAVDGVKGYNIYLVGEETTLLTTASASPYRDLTTLVTLADNSSYVFGVSAFNDFGESAIKTTTLDTSVPPSAELVVVADEYDADAKSVALSWNEVATATGYRVEELVGEEWTVVASVSATEYVMTDLEDGGDYTVRVVAFNAVGDGSIGEVAFSTAVAPNAPTNVSFGGYDSNSKSATLTWDAVDNATGYSVQLYDAATNTWVDVDRDDATATSYELTDMTDNATYYARVAAYNDKGVSAWVEAGISASTAPLAPTNVAAVFNRPAKTATISWDFADAADGYYVYQRDDVNGWTKLATVASISRVYLATDLELFTSYVFGVSAFNAEGESPIASVELSTLVAPDAVANLTVVDADSYNGDGVVSVEWDAAEGAVGYAVELMLDDEIVATAETTATSYSFEGLDNYLDYVVSVVAFNDAGRSDASTATFSTMTVPAAELELSVAYDYAAKVANLTWNDVDYATGYRVELSTDGEAWIVVGTTEETEYQLSELVDFTGYVCRVVSYNDKGDGSFDASSFFTLAAPAAPGDAAFGEFVATTGSATLEWSPVEYATGYSVERLVGEDWVVVLRDDASAFADGDSMAYTFSDLVENATYQARVAAYNDAGDSEYVVATLDTTVGAAPNAPSGFEITNYDAETHKATMVWVDNSTNETGFEVDYSYDGENWIQAGILGANATSRIATRLVPGATYHFRIAAFNDYGYSDWVTTTYDVPAEIPAAPSNVAFGEYDAENAQIEMTWVDNSDNELGFKVQYSYDQSVWYTAESTDANVTSRIATNLVPGRAYYFRVAAYNLSGLSDWAVGSVEIPGAVANAPAAPTNLVFSDGAFTTSGATVVMSWTDNSDDEDRFVVQFSYDGSSWFGAGVTAANETSRTAEGLVEGREYHFRVAAYNANGYSDWLYGVYTVPYETVNAPSDITFGDYVNGTVEMSWADNSDDEVGFVVQYSYDGTNWHRAGTTDANVTSRTATKMTPGRTYYFRVAAFNGASYSDWAYGSFTTPSGAPTAPGALTFSNYSASSRTVEMSWVDNSNDEVGFNVEYSIDAGETWLASGSTSADVNYRTATGLRVGTTYEFRVRAYNAYGASGWSYGEYKVAVAEGAPEAPTDFVFGDYDADAKTLAMSWTDNSDDETGFKAQYSVDGGATWYAAGTYGANVTSRVATSVVAGRTYVFRVAAFNESGESQWLVSESYEVPVSVNIPKAPTNLTFSDYDAATGALTMTWEDNSTNEKGFKVEYSVDAGETWNISAYVQADATSRVATGLVAGRTYNFRVSAYNNYGQSDYAEGAYSVVALEEVAAPEITGFSYSSKKRTIEFAWTDVAPSYNAFYSVNDDTAQYSLTVVGNTATISNAVYGFVYNVFVQSVGEGGAVSDWATETYDTTSGDSAAVIDAVAESVLADSDQTSALDEFFKDYFEDLL